MDLARNLVAAARRFTASAPERARALRLRTDVHAPDAIRDIARARLHGARTALDRTPARKLGEAVHVTRKGLERARAGVRQSRDLIGEQAHRRATAVRSAAQRNSPPRDAKVLLTTLDALTERFADELPPSATVALRARLEKESKGAAAALADGDGVVAAAGVTRDGGPARATTWDFERDGLDALSRELHTIYRRGRKTMRAAREDPSAENLQEWRRRTQALWHTTQIVGCAQPKELKRVARRARKLSRVLGTHHDLDVLRAYVESHPQCFDAEGDRQALLSVVDRRARRLCEKALARGRKLYGRKPKRFVREVERGWRKRADNVPKRAAG